MGEETVKNKGPTSTSAYEGKYLTFALGKEEYGLEILQVREIIGLMHITLIPRAPSYMKGVINLRGRIIPVIDLRLKFGMDSQAYTPETCIIVLNLSEVLMGIIVDKVSEVIDITRAHIEQSPRLGGDVNTDFITGMGKVSDKVIILLDIEKVLNEDRTLAQQAKEIKPS